MSGILFSRTGGTGSGAEGAEGVENAKGCRMASVGLGAECVMGGEFVMRAECGIGAHCGTGETGRRVERTSGTASIRCIVAGGMGVRRMALRYVRGMETDENQ